MTEFPGRYPGAIWIPSHHYWPGNFGFDGPGRNSGRPAFSDDTPRVAVIDHVMVGYISYLDQMARSLNGIDGRRVSVHFGIDETDGTVHQYVDLHDWAWGNGLVNILDWPLRNRIGFRPRKTQPNGNIGTISIEHPGTGRDWKDLKAYSPTNPWPEQVVEASCKLHEWLFAEGVIDGVPQLGSTLSDHADLSTNKADDPGTEWRRSVRPLVLKSAQTGYANRISEAQVAALTAKQADDADADPAAAAPAPADTPPPKLDEPATWSEHIQAQIDDLNTRVAASEHERKLLLDGLAELLDNLQESPA